MNDSWKDAITDIPGIRVGHAQDEDALTGCTVILCEGGAVGGVDQRGGAPGTRETDLLRTGHLVDKVNAILLTGGSAFGLDAAAGVVRYLREKGVGYNVGVTHVPIVPAAVIFDLQIGKSDVYPDGEMGYQACLNATDERPTEGNAGAGMGATVGKTLGPLQAMKSGFGSASIDAGNGVIVAAAMVINAFGDVIDPNTGQIIAGARSSQETTTEFVDTLEVLKSPLGPMILGAGAATNTCIGVIATNARLSKEGANKVAQMAHNGLGRTIRPAHTMVDGDTLFSIATGDVQSNVNIVGAFAAEVTAQACIRAVRSASSAGGLPGLTG